jgi:hypothetical protein
VKRYSLSKFTYHVDKPKFNTVREFIETTIKLKVSKTEDFPVDMGKSKEIFIFNSQVDESKPIVFFEPDGILYNMYIPDEYEAFRFKPYKDEDLIVGKS